MTSNASPVAEWRANGPMVLAAMVGLSFMSVASYSLTVFIEPLSSEFGWSRAQLSLGLAVFAVVAVPLSPFVGAAIDRWGSRRVAIPGTVLTGCALACFGLANGSFAQWIALWGAFSLFSMAITVPVWSSAVSCRFERSRGLALAVTLCGTALAQTFAPLIAAYLIDSSGWRAAFGWMAAGWGGVSLLLTALLFRDAKADERTRAKRAGEDVVHSTPLTGLSVSEAYRNSAILRIATAVFLTSFLGSAITVHKVPILTELGLTRDDAVLIASSAGVAGIAGKLICGWMFDRWSSGWIGVVSLGLPALCFACMVGPIQSSSLTIVGMVLLGFSTGAILQAATYLIGRYGGLRHFGKIFGAVASLIALGAGLGPTLAGLLYDIWGSYTPMLALGVPLGATAGLLVFRLGPFPRFAAATPLSPALAANTALL